MDVKDVELGREAKKIGRGFNISEVKRDKIYMYVYICVYFHILRSQQLGWYKQTPLESKITSKTLQRECEMNKCE